MAAAQELGALRVLRVLSLAITPAATTIGLATSESIELVTPDIASVLTSQSMKLNT